MKFKLGDYIMFVTDYPEDDDVDWLDHSGKIIGISDTVSEGSKTTLFKEYHIDWFNDYQEWCNANKIDEEYVINVALTRKIKLDSIL